MTGPAGTGRVVRSGRDNQPMLRSSVLHQQPLSSQQQRTHTLTHHGRAELLLLRSEDVVIRPEGPCIRCARCVQGCPMKLLPTTIAAYARRDMLAEAEEYRAMDCIECGCCSYSCPATIPLVQAIRYGKAAIIAKKRNMSAT